MPYIDKMDTEDAYKTFYFAISLFRAKILLGKTQHVPNGSWKDLCARERERRPAKAPASSMSVGKLFLGALKEAFLLSPPEKQPPKEPLTLNGPNRIPGDRPPLDWLNAELERRNPHLQARREELGLVRDERTRQLLASPGPAGKATRGADFLTRREGRHHPYDQRGGGTAGSGANQPARAPFRTPGPRVQIDFAGDGDGSGGADPLTTLVTRAAPVSSHRRGPTIGRPGWHPAHPSTGADNKGGIAASGSRWAGASTVGSQHRYPTAAHKFGAGTYQTAADFSAFLAVRQAAPTPDAAGDGDSTFEQSAMKQARARAAESEEDRAERLAREHAGADASPVMNDALQTRMFTGHYAHGPRPITPFRERGADGAGGDASIDIDRSDLRNASVREATAMTFRAGAERIASATPDMRALHDRSRFKAGYHVASAAAASNGVHDGGSKPAPLGGYFGGALAPAQLEFRRSTAWKKLGLDVRDVDAYKKLVEASSAGRARRRPTSAPPDSARKSALDHADSSDDEKDVGPVAKRRPRGAAKPKKPVTQYRMKAPPPAGLTPNRRTSLDSYVDDAIDGLRRSTSQALGDVSADSPPEPARTALTPTQRRELALEVRAANASVSAPVDVALEADLERQIAEMELAAKDLEVKRAELKSPAGLLGGEDEGPSAAEIEAMEAELTRPLSAEQADAIERAYAPGSPSEIVASGKFTGQGVLEVRVYFFILVCGGN